MSALYLETSALLRIMLSQADSTELVARVRASKRLITSRLTRVEAERAFLRLSVDEPEVAKKLTDLERDLNQLWARIDFIEMDEKVCELAGRLSPRSRIRSLDAIHLATFHLLRQKDESIEMLTCDDRISRELP